MSGITLRTGHEGPKNDPYYFEEFCVERPDGRIAHFHLGLLVHVRYDGGMGEPMGEEELDIRARVFCGLTVQGLRRAVRKAAEVPYRLHRPHGGVTWYAGYPGETQCVCKCGRIIDSTFNRSAIE